MTAGRVINLRWHATHGGFETGTDQLQAHWLAWLGAVALLTTASVGARNRLHRSPGSLILSVSAWLYASGAV